MQTDFPARRIVFLEADVEVTARMGRRASRKVQLVLTFQSTNLSYLKSLWRVSAGISRCDPPKLEIPYAE